MSRRLFGGSKSKSTNTSSSGVDPRFANAFFNNLDRATNVANNLGPREFADFGEDWFAGRDLARNTILGGEGMDMVRDAGDIMRNAAGFQPSNVTAQTITGQGFNPSFAGSQGFDASLAGARGFDASLAGSQGFDATLGNAAQLGRGSVRDVTAQNVGAQGFEAALAEAAQANRGDIRDVQAQQIAAAQGDRGDIRDVSGGSFLNMNLGAYMNPFLQQVAGNTASDMDRSRQMVQQQNASRAAQAGAFGGSRQGILEAETNRNFFDRLGSTLGDLYSRGFDTAAGMAGQDLSRGLQAQQLNQGQDANVFTQNLANQQQAALQNAANNLQAQGMNQGMDAQTSFLNANLSQGANLANTAAQNQASMFGANAANQASLANAQNSLQAQALNQGMDFNVAGMNASNQQGMNLANMAAQNQASMFGANAANTASLANAAAQNQASMFGAAADNTASLANAAALNQAGMFGANAANQASLANAGFANQAGMFGANAANQAAMANQQANLSADLANQNAGLTANQQSIMAGNQLGSLGGQLQNMGLQGAGALAEFGLAEQQQQQQVLDAIRNLPIEQQQLINQALGINPGGGAGMTSTSTGSSSGGSETGIIPGLGQAAGLAMFLSDRDMKENISGIDDPLGKLAKLSGHEYNYRGDDGRTAGVMAQDVEQVLPGAVGRSPFGAKMVNYPEVTGLLVEAVNELAKKQKRGRRNA